MGWNRPWGPNRPSRASLQGQRNRRPRVEPLAYWRFPPRQPLKEPSQGTRERDPRKAGSALPAYRTTRLILGGPRQDSGPRRGGRTIKLGAVFLDGVPNRVHNAQTRGTCAAAWSSPPNIAAASWKRGEFWLRRGPAATTSATSALETTAANRARIHVRLPVHAAGSDDLMVDRIVRSHCHWLLRNPKIPSQPQRRPTIGKRSHLAFSGIASAR